jgi:hypothetical protein
MIPFSEVVNPPLKLKVKPTVAFLQVKPQAIRLAVKPQYPARLLGGTAISAVKANGDVTVNLDVSELQEVTSLSASQYVVLWDSISGQYSRIKASSL